MTRPSSAFQRFKKPVTVSLAKHAVKRYVVELAVDALRGPAAIASDLLSGNKALTTSGWMTDWVRAARDCPCGTQGEGKGCTACEAWGGAELRTVQLTDLLLSVGPCAGMLKRIAVDLGLKEKAALI